jgi:hypothetical protein
MKKILGFLVLFASQAFASPFLVCDPVPVGANTPVFYTISGVPGLSNAPAVAVTGGVALHLDLSTVKNGTYTVTATATNSAGTSAPSAPFTLILPVPVTPGSPSNLNISLQ